MRWSAGGFASNCFLCKFDPVPKRAVTGAMAVLRALALVWMVHRTAATVATTLANCQSACNLGEMLCLNKNASSTLCSAVQGACMAGCYASRVECACADASVTPCEEIKLQAPHANDAALTPRTRPSNAIARANLAALSNRGCACSIQ